MKELFKINNATNYTFAKVGESENSIQYTVKGDVCHYNVRNQNYEIDLKGCFSEHLKSVKENGHAIPLVLNHFDKDADTIGKFVEFEDGESYLWGLAELVKTPYIVNEVIPKIEAGIYPCFSTYGWATQGHWDNEKEAFIVEKGILNNVALVSQGADVRAKATLSELKNKFSSYEPKKSTFIFGFNK